MIIDPFYPLFFIFVFYFPLVYFWKISSCILQMGENSDRRNQFINFRAVTFQKKGGTCLPLLPLLFLLPPTIPDSWSMSIKKASVAAAPPVAMVAFKGTPVPERVRQNHLGSSPSLPMARRMRGWGRREPRRVVERAERAPRATKYLGEREGQSGECNKEWGGREGGTGCWDGI